MPPSRPLADASAPGDGRRCEAPRMPRRGAAGPSRFFALRGNVSGSPRRLAAQAPVNGHSVQAGCFGRADCGAQIHHRLGEIAGSLRRPQPLRQGADRGLGDRQFALDRIEACDHAFHIAVDRARRTAERDGGDRRRGIGTDAGQREQIPPRRRERRRRGGRPPPGRRRGDGGHGHNSRARPTA